MAGFTEGLVELLSQVPQPPSHEQAQVAGQVIALFNEFDLDAAAGLFERPSAGLEEWVQWLRARVGECGAGEPMMVKDDSVRYRYTCEHGQLEAQFSLSPETGKIPGLMMAARGIELAEPVREAAETVMRLYDQWDPALFRRSFSEKSKRRRSAGSCSTCARSTATARSASPTSSVCAARSST
ncbi:hypothetical protein [Nannocystis pusilla]|uniref:hypothetical protein n=1 Tax=Nannocystis pusilla TaxID=889268 RepID=UPI003B820F2C